MAYQTPASFLEAVMSQHTSKFSRSCDVTTQKNLNHSNFELVE